MVIAGNTLREAVRQKLAGFFMVIAAGLIVSSLLLRDFNFGASELKFLTDFGFGALVFFGSALTIAATTQLFFSEIENRTALTLLAKPVWRTEFIFGKLAGIMAVVLGFCALLTALLALLLWWREGALRAGMPGVARSVHYADLGLAGLLQWLKFGVLAAMTLLLATFSNTQLGTMVLGFFVLIICHLQYLAREAYAQTGALAVRLSMRLLGSFFPDFQVFNLGDQVAAGQGIPWEVATRAGAYAVIYIAGFGALAVYSFRHREV
jgi:ABC-type transport system involved in multi-copper enzyme maturation permease subunit